MMEKVVLIKVVESRKAPFDHSKIRFKRGKWIKVLRKARLIWAVFRTSGKIAKMTS